MTLDDFEYIVVHKCHMDSNIVIFVQISSFIKMVDRMKHSCDLVMRSAVWVVLRAAQQEQGCQGQLLLCVRDTECP